MCIHRSAPVQRLQTTSQVYHVQLQKASPLKEKGGRKCAFTDQHQSIDHRFQKPLGLSQLQKASRDYRRISLNISCKISLKNATDSNICRWSTISPAYQLAHTRAVSQNADKIKEKQQLVKREERDVFLPLTIPTMFQQP